jgi:hypothetical protein
LALEQVAIWEVEGLDVIHPNDRESFRTAWREGMRLKTPIRFQARVKGRDGNFVAYESRAVPVEDDQGEAVEWHGISVPAVETAGNSVVELEAAHVKAARALLDWTGPDLADRSNVSFSTIKRLEAGEHVKADMKKRVQDTFEAAGIQFKADGTGDIWIKRRGEISGF